MKPLIHISPRDIGSLNGLTSFSNANAIVKYLDPVDYHFVMFSTLYQSGVDYFEVDQKSIPEEILDNTFWNSKLTGYNSKALDNSIEKAVVVLEGRFNIEVDNKYNVPQYPAVLDYLSKLFYSLETGIPFINPDFILPKDFDLLEPRMNRELLNSMRNLNSLIINEKIQTITPEYSVLKSDVKRFEDICHSKDFRNYSNSLQLLPVSSKTKSIKKDISVNSLKLFNKYGNNFTFKETAFSFIKFNKKIVDTFVTKIPATVGDFVINSIEKLATNKQRIYFHEVKEAKYSTLLCNRIDELVREVGNDKFKVVIDELKKEKNYR